MRSNDVETVFRRVNPDNWDDWDFCPVVSLPRAQLRGFLV